MNAIEAQSIAAAAIQGGLFHTAEQVQERRRRESARLTKRQQREYWVKHGLTTLGQPRRRRPNTGLNDDHTEYMRAWRAPKQKQRRKAKLKAKLAELRAEVARVEQELRRHE